MERIFRKAIWVFVVTLGIPTAAGAAITSYTDVISVITNIQGWLYGILIALAVVFIIVSAYFFLTAAGDPKKVERAKSQLIYSVIAVAVAILSRTIIKLIEGVLNP